MRSKKALPNIRIVLTIALFGLIGVSLSASANQDKPTYRATGSEATLTGTISFVGPAPEPKRMDMSADPICERLNPDPAVGWVIVTDHKLANVVVYVRGESLDSYSFEIPAQAVALEHKACRYVPHVLGIQTKQTLRVLNGDSTTHNTHAATTSNPDWNISQASGAAAVEHLFTSPEVFIPIKDNQHPWERAYVGVFSHPFFSVSSTDGSYKISGLPPGRYTVVAWHESLGEQTVDVFLGGSEQRNLDFTFKPSHR
ncbi:MAG: carboxypeptidase-like regulatory domain-containing protein [Acidobacteriota bacterium]